MMQQSPPRPRLSDAEFDALLDEIAVILGVPAEVAAAAKAEARATVEREKNAAACATLIARRHS